MLTLFTILGDILFFLIIVISVLVLFVKLSMFILKQVTRKENTTKDVIELEIKPLSELCELGFQKIGFWQYKDNSLNFIIDFDIQTNCLYAFVVDDEVKYIGNTTTPLSKRLYGYKNPGLTQRTNSRVNRLVKGILLGNKVVEIYSLKDDDTTIGRFNLNLAAGLEIGLINKIHPEWNIHGKTKKQKPRKTYKGKYQKLNIFLANKKNETSLILSYEDIENIIATKLPKSAYKYREWWANGGQRHSDIWLKANWKVSKVKLSESVCFEKDITLNEHTGQYPCTNG